MTYKLLSDSTMDITQEMAKDLGIDVISLKFTINDNTYNGDLGATELSKSAFYKLLREGKMATTSQINTGEFTDWFEKYLSEGQDILYIAFSSGLSGTYQSATIAQKELAVKYPERKIVIVDSLSASMGEGLMVYIAAKKRQEGLSLEKLAQWLELNKLKLAQWFTVDDLHHLKRGGRVSAATAMVGTMLGIKPVLHVDDTGHLIPKEKIRGRKQSLDFLAKKLDELAININEQDIFISHGDCILDAEYLANKIKEKHSPKSIVINHIGPVIGSHSGPGTVALFFLATNR